MLDAVPFWLLALLVALFCIVVCFLVMGWHKSPGDIAGQGRLTTFVFILACLAGVLGPAVVRIYDTRQLGHCMRALEDVHGSLGRYAAAHKGVLPESLAEAKAAPECPGKQVPYEYLHQGETYTVTCRGRHRGVELLRVTPKDGLVLER